VVDQRSQTCRIFRQDTVADGAYRKMECMGGGAFGEVYLVLEVDSGKMYAAKLEEEEYSLLWEAEMLERV